MADSMTTEATIQTALGALVGGRCYFGGHMPDPAVKPYIVCAIISDVMANNLDGFAGISQKRMQVDAYTMGYETTAALSVLVKSTMATILPQSVHLSNIPMYEPDTQLYCITMDFSLWS